MSGGAQHPRSPDLTPEAFWRAGQYGVALTSLAARVLGDTGVLVLTGEPGTGKTALTHALAAEVEREGVVVGRLLYPVLEDLDFLSGIAEAFGLPGAFTTRIEFDVTFDRFAASTRERGARLLLIVDDAQSLPASSLGEVARLTGCSVEGVRGLTVLLAGHDSLSEAVRAAGIEPGLAVRVRLLTGEESLEYIRHRLRVDRRSEDVLSAPAMERICREAGGIPQMIDVLCQHAAADATGRDAGGAKPGRRRRAARRHARVRRARLTRSRGAVITIVAVTLATAGTAALALTRFAHRRVQPAVSVRVPSNPAPLPSAEPSRAATIAPEPSSVTAGEGTDTSRSATTVPAQSNVTSDAPGEPAGAPPSVPPLPERTNVARDVSPSDEASSTTKSKPVAKRDRTETAHPVPEPTREPPRPAPSTRRPPDDGATNDPSAIIDWMLEDRRPAPGSPLE